MSTAYNTFASWDAVKHHAFNHTLAYYGKAKTDDDDYRYIFDAVCRDLITKRSVTYCGIDIHMPHSEKDTFLSYRWGEAPSPEATEYAVQFRKQINDGIRDGYGYLSNKRKSFKRSDWVIKTSTGYDVWDAGMMGSKEELAGLEHGELFHKYMGCIKIEKDEYEGWRAQCAGKEVSLSHEETLHDTIINIACGFSACVSRFLNELKETAANGHDAFEENAREVYWGKALPNELVDSLIASFIKDGMPEEKVYVVWKEEDEHGKVTIHLDLKANVEELHAGAVTGSHNYVHPIWKKLKNIDALRSQGNYKRNKIDELNNSIFKEKMEIEELKKKREAMNEELRNLIEKS
jgi:hypothetical protein